MVQLPTTLRILGLVSRPKALLPSIKVDDIRQLNFPALKQLGYRGVVFDKDNCITKPHVDTLLPHLQDSWNSCVQTFGANKVLIVSNSSGTRNDAGWLGAEALHRSTGVPVLLHAKKKPFCHQEVSDYFSLSLTTPLTSTGRPTPTISNSALGSSTSLAPATLAPLSTSTPPLPINPPTPDSKSLTTTLAPPVPNSLGILVIGDRLLTDSLLTSLLPSSPPSLSILTTLLPQPKDVRFLRLLERALERLIRRSTGVDHEVAMRRWKEMGVVKWGADEVGVVGEGWVARTKSVARGVGKGLELIGRGTRWVGRGGKKVWAVAGKQKGEEKAVGGEEVVGLIGGKELEKKVLQVESVVGAGSGAAGVKTGREVLLEEGAMKPPVAVGVGEGGKPTV